MSVVKPPSSSTQYRTKLAQNIPENGFLVMPCSWCDSQGLTCRMMDKVKRCEACVRRGCSCDGSGVSTLSREFFVISFFFFGFC